MSFGSVPAFTSSWSLYPSSSVSGLLGSVWYDNLNESSEILVYHTDPFSADTDGDGLTDSQEVNTYGTDPTETDSDGDGLTDSQEVKKYNTDPNLKDSDNDGSSDFDEIVTCPKKFCMFGKKVRKNIKKKRDHALYFYDNAFVGVLHLKIITYRIIFLSTSKFF